MPNGSNKSKNCIMRLWKSYPPSVNLFSMNLAAQITGEAQKNATGFQSSVHQTAETLTEISESGTEHAVIKVKKHKLAWFTAVIFIAALIAVGYFAY